jgi:hypothetical protein
MRERQDSETLPDLEELSDLEPEERKKIAAALREHAGDEGAGLLAVRVMRIVLKHGRSAEDVVKVLAALGAARASGVPERRFIMGLERVLGTVSAETSIENVLDMLKEALQRNGKHE